MARVGRQKKESFLLQSRQAIDEITGGYIECEMDLYVQHLDTPVIGALDLDLGRGPEAMIRRLSFFPSAMRMWKDARKSTDSPTIPTEVMFVRRSAEGTHNSCAMVTDPEDDTITPPPQSLKADMTLHTMNQTLSPDTSLLRHGAVQR
ncbi:unnamed protein product [Caretta caretta]